jgi:hypothetical protein
MFLSSPVSPLSAETNKIGEVPPFTPHTPLSPQIGSGTSAIRRILLGSGRAASFESAVSRT